MRRFISSREVLSAPRWPPTRLIEVRFPEPEHLEGIWIPVGVFHMPARQRDRQELRPSRNRWKTQIVHVVTVVQVADFQRRPSHGFSPMQVRQAIGPRHGNTDFVPRRKVRDAPRPSDADKSGA
ncbi:MAG: hypothetical protein ACK55Z_04315, partial [bacterium]